MKPDLTLDDLFGPGAIAKASEAKAKRKSEEFYPEALTTFILRQTCKCCGSSYEAPEFSPNSTFIRGRIEGGFDYRQHYGGYDHLPHELKYHHRELAKCHKCLGKDTTETTDPWHPLLRGERQFYHNLLTGGEREKLIRKEEELGYEIAEELWEHLQ